MGLLFDRDPAKRTRETVEMDSRVAAAHSDAATERAHRNLQHAEAAAARRASEATTRPSLLGRILAFLRPGG